MRDPLAAAAFSAQDLGLILQAASFAAQKHRHQRRKDAEQTPYINHPLAVAQMLSEVALPDAVMIAAALLHDTVEDTDTALEEIEQSFGTDVRQVVAEVTDDKSLPKAVRKQRQIEHAGCVSDRAKLIKLADKIANIRDVVLNPPAHWSSDRKLAYLDWAKQVIDQIRGIHPDLETRFDHWYEQGKQSLDANHSE